MKKVLLFAAIVGVGVLTVTADPIDLERAKQLAAEYMPTGTDPVLVNNGQSVNMKRRAAAKLPTQIRPYYIFSRGEHRGFVIVAGDDLLPEVIGCTEQGDFDIANMPPALQDYLYGFEVALDKYHAYVEENGEEAARRLVTSRRAAAKPRRAASRNIDPIMTSAWGQGWPYYDLCPMDGNNRSATGCVATSTSSVIHYWRRDCPRYTLNSTSDYETWTKKIQVKGYKAGFPMRWELMKDSYDGTNYGNGSDYYTSAAELVSIVGTAVHMDYAAGSSGAQSSEQPNALAVFNLHGENVWYSGVNNMDNWENMIAEDLEAGRPILYSGYTPEWAGHAFVLDGYRLSDGKYYFDFGWNGGWNGWFALSDANGFNTDQSMTYHIWPNRQNLSAEISAPNFQANTNNTVTVTVRNNGTKDYTSAVNIFCTTTPVQPTAWENYQANWTTIPAGGSDVNLTFTVNPGAGSVWYLTVVDNTFHILDRIKVPGDFEDVTSKISNPSFETFNSNNRPTGWTYADGQYSRPADNDTWRAVGCNGTMVLDSWLSGNTGNAISQTLTGLIPGTYQLKAKVATDPGNTVTVFAGDKTVTTGAHDCGKYYLQEVSIDGITVGSDGKLSIGVNAGSWYKADDFRLYRYLTTPDYTYATVKNAAEGQDFYDLTNAYAPWLSTASLGEYTNNGFAIGTWGNYSGSDGAAMSAPFIERWTESTKMLDNGGFQQTIRELQNGTYYIGGSFMATAQGGEGRNVEGVTFWAGDQAVSLGTRNGVPEIYALKVTVTDGTLTFGMKTEMTTANWVAVDNLFLYWAGTEESYYALASAANPIRVPLLTNPRMESDLAGWTLNGNLWKQGATYDNFDPDFMESWTGSEGALANMSATQSIYLYKGTYALRAAVNAVRQNNASLSVKGVTLRLGDKTVACHTGNGAPEYFTTEKFTATDKGNVTAGLFIEGTDANWVGWDNAVVLCYGADVEIITPYARALEYCQNARNTYESSTSGAATAALAQYTWTDAEYATKTADEIQTAITVLTNGAKIAEAGQDATQFVVNASLSDTSLSGEAPAGWTMGIKSVEGSGDVWIRDQDGARVYNIWYPTLNDLEINQNVTGLPNGTYRLSVDLGTDFSGDAADMVAFIIGERVGASEQVSTRNTGAARAFGTYTCAATTTTNSVFFGIRALKSYIQMKNVHLQFISDTAAEQETDASYLRQDYFWGGRDAAYVDYTTNGDLALYGQAVGVRFYPRNKNQVIYAATATQFVSTQNNVVANGQCQNFVLTDGTPLEVPKAFSAANATYSRDMSSKWGTVLVPYAISSNDAVQYYTLSSVIESSMKFTPATSVPANTPAVFRRLDESATRVTLSATSVGVSQTTSASTADDCDGWSLVGSYTAQTVTDANAYYIAQDKFWKTSGSITLNPFRSYFVNTTGSSVKQLAIEIDETATGIQFVESGALRDESEIYDLAGRKFSMVNGQWSMLPKGVYIINGQKVLIR